MIKNRRQWAEFIGIKSSSFVQDLVPEAINITADMLVDMTDYKNSTVIPAKAGIQNNIKMDTDFHRYDDIEKPIITCLAYAQEQLIYDNYGKIIAVDAKTYATTTRKQRVNKFGLAYHHDTKLYLHKTLADIIIATADYLYKTEGWSTVIYDGLRTVNGAFRLYNFASDEDIASNILALPAKSAHNKGLAVDSMMLDKNGCEIEMGGHFDHLDMSTNMRNYEGNKISPLAKKNRLIREAAFLRSAFSLGLLIAPLRSEFWDDRLPENRQDLWRVLDSTARVVGATPILTNKENWKYEDFLENWQKTFTGHEEKLQEIIGCTMPPLTEKLEFYHGNYNPIYEYT